MALIAPAGVKLSSVQNNKTYRSKSSGESHTGYKTCLLPVRTNEDFKIKVLKSLIRVSVLTRSSITHFKRVT